MVGKNKRGSSKIINKSGKKPVLTRKLGIWLVIIGIAMQFLNIITYGLWGFDIDILGALIVIIGIIIMIARWKIKR